MKKRIFSLLFICALALTLTACSKEPVEEKPTDNPPVEQPDDQKPPVTSDTMAELYGYMGKADKDFVTAYGEGKKIMGDGDTLTGREYRMTLFGMETPVIVNYDKDGMVDSIHLAPTDFDKDTWSKTLTDTYGDPTGEADAPQWVKDGMIFSFGENDRIHVSKEK